MVNALLVLVKLIAGIVGHANALVADAIESSADIFSSLIVWMGLSIATRPADEDPHHNRLGAHARGCTGAVRAYQ